MFKILYNGRSGLAANQNRLDLISNNIANINTNGYKRLDASFEDIYYENMNRLGMPVTNNNEKLISGSGVRGDRTTTNFAQGGFQQTDEESDLAINGSGYFKLLDADGNSFYTRDGSFNMDSSGNFVHTSGLVLSINDYKPEQLKPPFSIDKNGNIYSSKSLANADASESTDSAENIDKNEPIGKIDLYNFKSNDSLIASGQNVFQYSGNEEDITTSDSSLLQGSTERSNVDIGTELTDMLVTQRAYELNSKSVQAADQMWQIANNLRGK